MVHVTSAFLFASLLLNAASSSFALPLSVRGNVAGDALVARALPVGAIEPVFAREVDAAANLNSRQDVQPIQHRESSLKSSKRDSTPKRRHARDIYVVGKGAGCRVRPHRHRHPDYYYDDDDYYYDDDYDYQGSGKPTAPPSGGPNVYQGPGGPAGAPPAGTPPAGTPPAGPVDPSTLPGGPGVPPSGPQGPGPQAPGAPTDPSAVPGGPNVPTGMPPAAGVPAPGVPPVDPSSVPTTLSGQGPAGVPPNVAPPPAAAPPPQSPPPTRPPTGPAPAAPAPPKQPPTKKPPTGPAPAPAPGH